MYNGAVSIPDGGHEPELKPPLNTLKAVPCRLVVIPGVSAPMRMGLRVVGCILMCVRQRRG